jgi:hypothetical protein
MIGSPRLYLRTKTRRKGVTLVIPDEIPAVDLAKAHGLKSNDRDRCHAKVHESWDSVELEWGESGDGIRNFKNEIDEKVVY